MAIYHGDCLQIIPMLSADLVVTSPPYNLMRKGAVAGRGSIHDRGHGCTMSAKMAHGWYPDDMDERKYQEWQARLVELMLAAAPCVCYNHKVRYQRRRSGSSIHPMQWLMPFPLWVEIVWDRRGGVAFNSRRPVPSDERIFVLGRPQAWNSMGLTTVWQIPPKPQGLNHPCPFPIALPLRLIAMFTRSGQTVLDPFMGTGTTLRAARDLGRRSIGIEIEERYCEIAAKRMRQEVLF